MENKNLVEFKEFKIENLQNVLGGEIINWTTGASTSYPQGDNVDITSDEYGRETNDGFGGGTCGAANGGGGNGG